jgi:hypothetical protein
MRRLARYRSPLLICLCLTFLAVQNAQAGRRRRCCATVDSGCAAPAPDCAVPCAGAGAAAAVAPAAEVYNPATEVPPTPAEDTAAATAPGEEGFVTISNGQNFDGWKINERPESWKLEDGCFVANGERSHLFFVGDDKPFENFELKVDCKAKANSNGGIYIHTKYQDENWPKFGHEVQVNNSYTHDPKKSGSLYGIVDVTEQHIPDDTWWTEHVIVNGKHITIKLNDKTVVDYVEPDDQPAFSNDFERRLGSGTFALQAHDPNSTIYYKNIRVKRLP